MRNLYNPTKGRIKIHPSPPQTLPSTTPNYSLATALTPEDQEVLAYLLSIHATNTNISKNRKPNKKFGDHPPQFNCGCFNCYTSFWVRWDASPNQKLIHEIIEVYEDGLVRGRKNGKSRKERGNKKGSSDAFHTVANVQQNLNCTPQRAEQKNIGGEGEISIGSSQKGSVRKIVSFVGERIWGVWGV
ncbi:uncharacterized protein LOC143562520 [Bidens hawaiensis]|uniref:uncharacterized protein LOC143562520 n=1 Tax=Bidens hawaiensis TaxID=980011 RepID=UPI00404A9CAF